jgi:uncharacterized membrane protein YkvA (DUF1232 family)
MADKKTGKLTVPPQDGMFRQAITRIKLITRLMGDRRVSPWIKLIPIGAVVYLVSPIDLIMGWLPWMMQRCCGLVHRFLLTFVLLMW